MTRPTKHPRTGVYRVRVGIPPAFREVTKRRHGVAQEFVQSLGTKNPAEAKRLAGPVIERFANYLRAAAAEAEGANVHLVLALAQRLIGIETSAKPSYCVGPRAVAP